MTVDRSAKPLTLHRRLLIALAASLLGYGLPLAAQTADKNLRRIGVLAPSTRAKEEVILQPFFDEMRALGWIDTFAIPAKGRNDAAAYAWINFTLRPAIAARIAKNIGNFSAARGAEPLTDPKLRAQFAESFPRGFKDVRWYPAIPPGLEEIEGRVLDRIKAAK